ncbi:molybdopterin oxidoreductase family protein, partial [Methylophilaceae bacterium]|nr:molybdopterin oxidoreductase family protein [Methylophilaceae bacterium]
GAKNFVAGPFRQMYEDFQPGQDIPELPDYIPSKESELANPELFKKYPLNILAPKSHGFINSCYGNIENKLKGQGEQFILINQADAIDRGIQEGEMIKIFNDRGSFDAVAKITSDVNKGIVVTTLGYWRQLNNGTVNSVSSSAFGDMGNAQTSHDCLVEVRTI